MAEAFGIAGSAVGIVSLGIQITQGLLKYYGSWKGQDIDIASICASLDSLSESLKILEKTIQPPTRFNKNIKDNVEKNVNAISGAIRKLDNELIKVHDVEWQCDAMCGERFIHLKKKHLTKFNDLLLKPVKTLI
jgi:hypothetical protein